MKMAASECHHQQMDVRLDGLGVDDGIPRAMLLKLAPYPTRPGVQFAGLIYTPLCLNELCVNVVVSAKRAKQAEKLLNLAKWSP